MILKQICVIILYFLFNHCLIAKESNIEELEKRITNLEKQVNILKKNSVNDALGKKWKHLKRGDNKISIKNELGHPDRVGKFSNGNEMWGFKNFTLIFDANGKLKKWSKPYLD